MAQRYHITTPIYYVNDVPHIGHAYTTIAADVLARHYRRRAGSDSVFFLTGTDEHGSKVAAKAVAAGMDPQSFADSVALQFQDAWSSLSVSHDFFIRTTSQAHCRAVEKILLMLKEARTPAGNPAVYQGTYSGLYCTGCEKFLRTQELVNGVCPDHGVAPVQLDEKNWFFRLSDYLTAVKDSIKSGAMSIRPAERRNETLMLFEQGLDDFSISRATVRWGIPIPWDSEQRAYVWVDALYNYITALGFPDDTRRVHDWWQNGHIMHLMGADILKFHAIYWPALLMALGLKPPSELLIHGYFTIDGRKMSKTLGNVIAPDELVARYGADASRYLILSQFSFGFESDIRAQDFEAKYTADLANDLGNLVSRVTAMTEKYCAGLLDADPAPDHDFQSAVGSLTEEARFRDALQLIWKLISACNRHIDKEKPWLAAVHDPERLRRTLQRLCRDLHSVADALEPYMPDTSNRIRSALSARPMVKFAGLFDKIETRAKPVRGN